MTNMKLLACFLSCFFIIQCLGKKIGTVPYLTHRYVSTVLRFGTVPVLLNLAQNVLNFESCESRYRTNDFIGTGIYLLTLLVVFWVRKG